METFFFLPVLLEENLQFEFAVNFFQVDFFISLISQNYFS